MFADKTELNMDETMMVELTDAQIEETSGAGFGLIIGVAAIKLGLLAAVFGLKAAAAHAGHNHGGGSHGGHNHGAGGSCNSGCS